MIYVFEKTDGSYDVLEDSLHQGSHNPAHDGLIKNVIETGVANADHPEIAGTGDDFETLDFIPEHGDAYGDVGLENTQVDAEYTGMRLDAFVAKIYPQHSRMRWQEWIRQGYVCIDENPVLQLSYRVVQGSVCLVRPLPQPKPCDLTPHPMDLVIHYEDSDLLVIEKPAGLVVHPGSGTFEPTLIHGLLAQCKDLSGIGGVQKPGLVHRLDKDTSGLMLIAKNDLAHQGLSEQFAQRSLEKKYWAFVWGQPSPPFGRIDTLLARNPRHRTQQAVVSTGGKQAVTTYHTLKSNGAISVLECGLLTGRTHQIRVHCAHLKHPLLGDTVYGNGAGHSRQALHAYSLRFDHPRTGEEIVVVSPLPPDLQSLWDSIT